MRFSFARFRGDWRGIAGAQEVDALAPHRRMHRFEMHQMGAAAHLDIAFDGRTEMPPTHFPAICFPGHFDRGRNNFEGSGVVGGQAEGNFGPGIQPARNPLAFPKALQQRILRTLAPGKQR
jgi:hypothetical protein